MNNNPTSNPHAYPTHYITSIRNNGRQGQSVQKYINSKFNSTNNHRDLTPRRAPNFRRITLVQKRICSPNYSNQSYVHPTHSKHLSPPLHLGHKYRKPTAVLASEYKGVNGQTWVQHRQDTTYSPIISVLTLPEVSDSVHIRLSASPGITHQNSQAQPVSQQQLKRGINLNESMEQILKQQKLSDVGSSNNSKFIEQYLLYNLTNPSTLTLKSGVVSIQYMTNSRYIGQISYTNPKHHEFNNTSLQQGSDKVNNNTANTTDMQAQHQKQGKGVYKYSNGDVYLGSWKQDNFNGLGTYIFSNGNVCKGLFHNGHIVKGIFIYVTNPDNSNVSNPNQNNAVVAIYEGSFKDGLKHGYGVMKYKNWDDVFLSNNTIQNNKKHQQKQNNKSSHQAQSQESNLKSKFEFNLTPNQSFQQVFLCEYAGFWSKDKKTGKGTLKCKQYIINGTWQQDRINGQVNIVSSKSQNNKRQILMSNSVNTTNNCIYFEYNGLMSNFQLIKGHLRIQYDDYSYYEGQVYRGKFQGPGRFVEPIPCMNNTKDVCISVDQGNFWVIYIYEGNFKQGKIQGRGVIKVHKIKKEKQLQRQTNSSLARKKLSILRYQDTFKNKQNEAQIQRNEEQQQSSQIYNLKAKGDRGDKAKILYSNGDVYEGQTKNNLRHGHGQYRYKSGDLYEGQFRNDMICGGLYQWRQ